MRRFLQQNLSRPRERVAKQPNRRAAWAGFMAIALLAQPVPGQTTDSRTQVPPQESGEVAASAADDILNMDIDQLGRVDVVVPSMDLEVTSVTRSESTVGRSPAAVFVITPEMIRRSGATCIPEVLRMVPGLEVARTNSNTWAITARGFNSRFANKLLVQVDGRSVYSPMFSGVHWETLDLVLEDVERIEVIRGPGATVWGANAVNGVISITTKKAKDTQGLLLSGGAGTEERGFTTARYGDSNGKDLHWRIYGKQFDRDRAFSPDRATHDDWRQEQGGFRVDFEPNCRETLTLQGDYFDGNIGGTSPQQFDTAPYSRDVVSDRDSSGGNVLFRWNRNLGKDRNWTLQAFYDRFERHSPALNEFRDTFDLDFQQQFPLSDRHKVVCGAGYRYWKNRTQGSFSFFMEPASRDADLFSYFVQDEITLEEDRWYLTVGSKFEHNEFSNFEFQPTARLLFSPDPRHSAWAAVSRAVRTPSLADEDMRNKILAISAGPPPPTFVQLEGDPRVEAEDLMAYEMGYRAQPTDGFSWDLAVFFNRYENLFLHVPTPLSFPAPAILSWPGRNGMDGETYGFELSSTWQLTDTWRLTGSYSYLQMQLHANPGIDSSVEAAEGTSPHNQAYMRSSWDLPHDLEFDLTLRYVDVLPRRQIPAYTTMDLRLAWRPTRHFEAAIIAQNLLDNHHPEFYGIESLATEVERSVYGMVTWRF